MDSTVMGEVSLEEHRQVEEILQSETFRTSEVLRHLFRFLADRTFDGEADSLKEYTIAIDALGKPSTYNPQHDSTVRIQVSRLRQKLGEYYRTEGRGAPLVVDIPKGRFKVTFETRNPRLLAPEPLAAETVRVPAKVSWLSSHRTVVGLSALLVMALAWCVYLQYQLVRSQHSSAVHLSVSPDVQKLWAPILDNKRPLILAVEDPMFLQFAVGSGIYYRDRNNDDWSQISSDPAVAKIRQLLDAPPPVASHYYSTLGEVSVAFIVGRLTARSQQHVSVVKASQLSWQEMADNNILIVGKHNFFDSQLRALPLHPELFTSDQGVENPNPRPGEPRLFTDSYKDNLPEEGEVYALVSRLPGAAGKGDFMTFLSNRSAGYVGALKWFTDPQFASMIAPKLADTSGKVATHYQVVLKIKFKDDVPTEITYVLGRQLT